ncbi:Aste57867_16653 [Aphanomyces stellatus]|uniref:Aste57867_16653 protein n=1 Tax=Aphanomyces stellatus TaxID=120398 RepID=A0A485L937_9STRA|nr:hypothetical protein As57867_016596 [Aphanomyces stellatus]VFT93424.1 Aste57867_16653 [Aphanomyces stellatus]
MLRRLGRPAAPHASSMLPFWRSFATKPKKPVVLSDFIRVRDLAKKLKVHVDDVVKHACKKHYHKYYMTHAGVDYKFDNLKQVILPVDMAARIATHYAAPVVYDSIEPPAFDDAQQQQVRPPVIAVMGHVDHGKTTLMDSLRGTEVAKHEVEGITQKIHVCDTTLAPDMPVTFLDTPGHFHFTRMRNNAAGVADVVVLVVAADEGCRLQTEESIGCIESLGVPSVVCINKMDIAPPGALERLTADVKEYVAVEHSPIVAISAKDGTNLDRLKATLLEVLRDVPLQACVGTGGNAQGTTLEVVASTGTGTVLRVLIVHGIVQKGDHFVCGMIHGMIKTIRRATGVVVDAATPGQVVDVTYKKLSRHKDAPLEFDFHVVSKERAEHILEQREMANDFAASVQVDDEAAAQEAADLPAKGFVGTPIVVKADTAGSLTSLLDTIDDMPGIHVAHFGLGNVTANDVDRGCTIFGFNVKVQSRERKLAETAGVHVVVRPTIHQLLEEISLVEEDAITEDEEEFVDEESTK